MCQLHKALNCNHSTPPKSILRREVTVQNLSAIATPMLSHLPLTSGSNAAEADFSTSFVKKNFPSFGTIMI